MVENVLHVLIAKCMERFSHKCDYHSENYLKTGGLFI